MALKDAGNGTEYAYCYSNEYADVIGVVSASTLSEAIKDYAGYTNTSYLTKNLSYPMAANACVGYIFPDKSLGYLGAAGEWNTYLNNKDAINSALELCGGTKISGSYHTSTQVGENNSWAMRGDISPVDKTSSYKVRPFTAL